MDSLPSAREMMRPQPCRTLHTSDTMASAVIHFMEHSACAAPVVDAEGKLAGILTERDLLRSVASCAFEANGPVVSGLVGESMSRHPEALTPGMDLFTIISRFVAIESPCLPVLENGKIMGCVHRSVLLRAILDAAKRHAGKLAKEEEFQSLLQKPGHAHHIEGAVSRMSNEQLAALLQHRDM